MEKPKPAPMGDIGTWEKHTKGIGLKLLQKFGFTGRLGANENGVSRAIEVVVRPGNTGIGFGDVKEASTLKVNKKIEAEWRGVEYVDVEEEQKQNAKKSSVERLASSKGWKKGKSDKESGRVKLSAEDYISKYMNDDVSGGQKQAQVIIDMRQKDTRVITDMTDIGSDAFLDEQAMANAKPKLGQELLYNINLLANMEEMSVTRDSKQLAREVHKIATLREDRAALERGIGAESARLARLQKILLILSRIEEKLDARENNKKNTNGSDTHSESETKAQDISLGSVCSLLRTLHQNFSEEFQIFGLINLLPNLISRVIVAEAWDPFQDHAYLCEIYDALSPLVEYFEEQDQRQLARQASKAFFDVVELRFLPVVRRAVASAQWDAVREPEACVRLFESLRLVLPAHSFDQTIDMFVLPKLTATVAAWRPSASPTSSEPSIHTWVHPWLPLLTTKLSVLYPEIRRKFGTLLSNFSFADSARVVDMLRPWVDVFDSTSFENLLVRSALPRLVAAMREEVRVNPAAQDIDPVQCMLEWTRLLPVLPLAHLSCLWVGEFFPMWLRVLYDWLTGHLGGAEQGGVGGAHPVEMADFEEVSAWYSGWKGLFPQALLDQDSVAECFSLALDMMQTSLTLDSDDSPASGAAGGVSAGHPMYAFKVAIERMEGANYYSLIEARKMVQRAQRRLDALEAEDSAAYNNNLKHASAAGVSSAHQQITFKEVVERFAARNNVEFVPKLGRYFEGKQLWQFGRALCYLDQNVVFVSVAEKGGKRGAEGGADSANVSASASRQELYGWTPVALDDLLLQA